MITNCTTCGQCYEAGSEEQANEPSRLCFACKARARSQDWEIRTNQPAPSMQEDCDPFTGTYSEACGEARRLIGDGKRSASVYSGNATTPWYSIGLRWVAGGGWMLGEENRNTNSGIVLLSDEQRDELFQRHLKAGGA